MKNKRKLSFKKMSIAQLDATKGGDLLVIYKTFPRDTNGNESQQPVGGICYGDAPTSIIWCV